MLGPHDKFVGNVEYGCFQGEEVVNIAKNALVIMISGLKMPWCVPFAYFLTNKLNANVLCQLVTESIRIVNEVGADVSGEDKIRKLVLPSGMKNIRKGISKMFLNLTFGNNL